MRHRIGEVTLPLLGPDRRPVADHAITVGQQRHDFAFGNIGFDFVRLVGGPDDPANVFGGAERIGLAVLAEAWLGRFNTATLPFYWGSYEPSRGTTQRPRLAATARWLAE